METIKMTKKGTRPGWYDELNDIVRRKNEKINNKVTKNSKKLRCLNLSWLIKTGRTFL